MVVQLHLKQDPSAVFCRAPYVADYVPLCRRVAEKLLVLIGHVHDGVVKRGSFQQGIEEIDQDYSVLLLSEDLLEPEIRKRVNEVLILMAVWFSKANILN